MISAFLQVSASSASKTAALATSSTASTVIIWSIVLLSAAALVNLLLVLMDARNDSGAIRENMKRIEVAIEEEELRAVASTLPDASHLRARLEICIDLRRLSAEADVTALRALTDDRLERSLRFPRWVAANVVLLGLLGTVIGLIVAVTQGSIAADAPSDADVPAALKLLDAVFAGLRTAFSTTLAGIVAAIGLGGVISFVRGVQLRMREDLERVSLTLLFPRMQTSPEQALAQAARSLMFIQKRLEEALTQVLAGIREHSEKTLSRLDAHTSTISGALAASSETFSSQMNSAATKFVERTAVASDALVGLVGDTSGTRVSLQELTSAVAEANARLAKSAEAVAAAAPVVGEQVARQVDAQTRDLAEVVAQLAKQAQDTLQEHSRGAVNAARELVKEEAGSRERHVMALLTAHGEHETRVAGELSRLAGAAETLETVANALKSRVEPRSAGTAQVEGALVDLHRTQEEALKVLRDLRGTMSGLATQAAESQAKSRSIFSIFGQR